MFTANNLAKLEEYQRLRNIGLTQKQALEETKLTNAMVLRAKKSKILTKSGLSTTSALEANLKTISPSGYVTAAFTAASVAARIWNGAISSNFEKAQSEIELADEQIQKYDEELSALNDLQSKLNDVGTNRENLAKIQVDLNKAIGETPGLLNGESDAFDKANLKIQARIEAIKLLRDEESKRKINATQTAFESKSLEDAIGILGINIDFSAQHMQQIARSQFATRNFWKDQGKTNEEIDEILDKGFSSSIGLTKKKYEDYQNELKRLAKEGLSDTISSYNGFGGSSIVDFIVDEFVDAGERDLNKINNALEDFIEDKDLQNLIDSYSSSLQDESENSEQYLGQINARLSILKNKFPEASAAFDVFYNTVVSGSENAEDSIDNFIENYEAKLKSLNEELDKIQSAYQTVAAAIEEYNENGYLSVDTYQKLLELAPEYMSMLMDESGNLTLTKESWRLLTEAKIRDMYQTQANQYIESIKAAADSGNLEQLDKLTQGYKNLAEAKVID